MDARVAGLIKEWLKIAIVAIPFALYCERRWASMELRSALEEERDKNRDHRTAVHESRLDRLDASAAARVDISQDGGFANPTIRGLLNGTIREQTRHLATSADVATEINRIRTELYARLERIIATNGLKKAE